MIIIVGLWMTKIINAQSTDRQREREKERDSEMHTNRTILLDLNPILAIYSNNCVRIGKVGIFQRKKK